MAWEYHFVGSRTLRIEFGKRLKARLGIRHWVVVVFSRRVRARYAGEACNVVTEMLQEYGAAGWELVAVVPYTVNFGKRIGFEWYFKRPANTIPAA